MKTLVALLFAAVCWAQQAPMLGTEQIGINAGNNLQYICITRSDQRLARTITVSAASNANPVSFTATAHGFYYLATGSVTPVVKITGGTGNWTAVNGVWAATPTSANAFTIAIDSSAFGALTGTLVVTTLAPSIDALVWSIQKLFYDASNNWTGGAWGSKPGGAGATQPLVAGSSAYNLACSQRALYAYQ